MFINIYRNPKNTKHLWLFFFGSGTKLSFTFMSLRFFDMRRERETHNFFLCWLFHLTPPHAASAANYWSGLGELRKSTCFIQAQISTHSFFQIPKSSTHRFQAWCHSRPQSISYLGFLLWHLWLSHLPRAHVNTCTPCVHLTNPCTKLKGKIYKTKNDNVKKIPPQLYNNWTTYGE